MTLQPIRKRNAADILFIMLLAAGIAIMLRKAAYGFHFFDEAYYYVVSYRMLQGDVFIAEEWSGTQFSLIMLYPFVKAYCSLNGGTEGLIVAGRYFFVFVHSVCTLSVYLLLRKNSPEKGLCAAAVYCLYSHLFIQALSYYQMSLDLILLCVLILAEKKSAKPALQAAGVLFALAVLSCPYLAFAYFIYATVCLIMAVAGKAKSESFFSGKDFARFTLGCAAAALVFLGFALSCAAPKDIIRAIPYSFSDETHSIGGAGIKLLSFLPELTRLFYITDIPLLIALAAVIIDKKRTERRMFYAFVLAAAGIVGLVLRYYGSFVDGVLTINHSFMKSVVLAGAAAYCLCEKKDRELFRFGYTGSVILLVCMYLVSDTGIAVFNTAMTVSAVVGTCFIVQLVSELRADGKKALPAAALCLALIALQLGVEFMYRKNYCFSEPVGVSMMYDTIDYGIGKGEKTTEVVRVYEQDGLWEATEKVRNAPGEYVLYFSDDSWPYLEDTKRCAAYTSWMQTENDINMAEKLLKYWEIYPEKKPDAIYVSKNNEHPMKVTELVNTENFPVEENDRGYVMIRPEGN